MISCVWSAAKSAQVGGVQFQHLVEHAALFHLNTAFLISHDTYKPSAGAHLILGGIATHQTDAAAGTEYQYILPRLHDL